jgi:hypothetical protein
LAREINDMRAAHNPAARVAIMRGLRQGNPPMPHRKDRDEEWAIALLEQIVARDRQDRDVLSGQAVDHVKRALVILKKRRRASGPGKRAD